MSLAIDTNRVTKVLLSDGWHDVVSCSFDIDAYEFVEGQRAILLGGKADGGTATGATWVNENGNRVSCPLTSVLAVLES